MIDLLKLQSVATSGQTSVTKREKNGFNRIGAVDSVDKVNGVCRVTGVGTNFLYYLLSYISMTTHPNYLRSLSQSYFVK